MWLYIPEELAATKFRFQDETKEVISKDHAADTMKSETEISIETSVNFYATSHPKRLAF
jgi:hypothetical protein